MRAAQPAWDAIGFAGRKRWLGSCATGSWPTRIGSTDLMQEETGRSAPTPRLRPFFCLDAINFWCDQGPRFLADEVISPHNPLLKVKKAKIVYRPYGVVGMISP